MISVEKFYIKWGNLACDDFKGANFLTDFVSTVY